MSSAKVVIVLSLTVLLLGTPRVALADTVEKGNFGLGLIVGEPSGVAAKLYLSDTTAVSAAAGFAFVSGGVHLHADYLWHPWVLTKESAFALPAYIGVGARVLSHNQGGGDADDVHLGARGVAGILFDFTKVPIDAFLEVAAVLEYRSADGGHGGFGKFGINAGAGVRYYF